MGDLIPSPFVSPDEFSKGFWISSDEKVCIPETQIVIAIQQAISDTLNSPITLDQKILRVEVLLQFLMIGRIAKMTMPKAQHIIQTIVRIEEGRNAPGQQYL
jgi:hypothetical protein